MKNSMLTFKNKLHEKKWKNILVIADTYIGYEIFLNKFMSLYDECFHENDVTVKTKTLKSDSHLPKNLRYLLH